MSADAKTIPSISVDAQTLHKRLTQVAPGEVVEYKTLTALIGMDVQRRAVGFLNTARNKAFVDDNMVFSCVRGVGLKRIDKPEEFNAIGTCAIERQHRMSGRTIKRMAKAPMDKFSNPEMIKHNALISALGAMYLMTKPSGIKAIEEKVSEAADKLPVGKTFALFLK